MKKILFVDDDRFFTAAYVEALRNRFEVHWPRGSVLEF